MGDCDHLAGRKRDICRGHDDDGNPVLTPEKCAAYRARWGIGEGAKQPPSMLRRILNYTDAYARYLASGCRDVGDETFAVRMEACGSCDRYNLEKDTCNECGCKMRTKCRWAVMACPLGKWGEE